MSCPTYPPYSSVPPGPPPSTVPAAYVDHLCLLAAQAQGAAVENERLRAKLTQKQLAEEAYRTVLAQSDGHTYSPGKNGTFVHLMNRTVERAFHVHPMPPMTSPPYYLIAISQETGWLFIKEADYFNDKVLLTALQERPGVEVDLIQSQRQTAALLRTAISQKLQPLTLSCYAGWTKVEGNEFSFRVFPGFKACLPGIVTQLPTELSPVSPSSAALAAEQLWPQFRPVSDQGDRCLLFLWFHAAALSSMLMKLGHRIPLALCLFTEDLAASQYLTRLFHWSADVPLSLDSKPVKFSQMVLLEKDKPLLIRDAYQTADASVNAAVLRSALTSGTVLWKNGIESLELPLQALPTLLSGAASTLSCSPDCLTLDLSAAGFDTSAWDYFSVREERLYGYLSAFLRFTQEHASKLVEALDSGWRQSMFYLDGTLNDNCLKTLGILLGLADFLSAFFEFCSPSVPPVSFEAQDWSDQLVEGLRQTTYKEDNWDLAGQFLQVARSHLVDGQLCASPVEVRKEQLPEDVVFCDEHTLSFTAPAFCRICRQLGQSRPTVLRALSEAGLMFGRPVNSATVMTRISIWDKFGVRRNLSVYRLVRSAFDLPGDPLLLEEESHEH